MNVHISQITTIATTPQWGFKAKQKTFLGPQWARFRAFVQYESGCAKYHSYDYFYKMQQGQKIKIKSENIGFNKLLELAHSFNKKQKKYRYINIFANLTNDMNTSSGNFDYLVCTIVGGEIRWKNKLVWKSEDPQMLDVKKIIELKEYGNTNI